MSCHLHGSEPALGVSASNKIDPYEKSRKFDHLRFANITSEGKGVSGSTHQLRNLTASRDYLTGLSERHQWRTRSFLFCSPHDRAFLKDRYTCCELFYNKIVSGRLIASSGTLDGDDTAIGTFDHRPRRTFDHRGLF